MTAGSLVDELAVQVEKPIANHTTPFADDHRMDNLACQRDKGEQQVRGAHKEELGLLLCSRGEVEHIAGETMCVKRALAEAEEICALLNARPESQLGQATEQLRRTQT